MTSERSTVYQTEASYTKSCSSSNNVFFDNEVKKDSEIQLNDIEIQPLVPSGELVNINQNSPQTSVMSPNQSNMAVTSSAECRYHSQTAETATAVRKLSDEHKLSQSDRSHICMTCFKGFRNKPQLTQHELVHNNVRKHVCQYCEKSFKQVCHLNQHLRVHTGERPYKCDVEGCGRSFAQLSNLNHHKKNHEDHVKRDISRQYRCDVCDRSYASKNSLITHVQKLHSIVKSMEGSGSLPAYSSTVPVRKKRKKNSSDYDETSNVDTSIVKTEPGFTGDHDLPTQVKVKSENGQNPGLTVPIGTSTSSDDKNSLNTMTTRTTLPLPFTIPFDHYHQGQGHTSYLTSFTNPTAFSQHLGQGHMLPNPPLHLSSSMDNASKPANIPQNPSHPLHAFNIKSERNERQNDHRSLSSSVSSHDAMQAEQRALMQVAVSQLDIGDKKQSHINQTYSQSLTSISNVHLLHQESMLPSNHPSGNHGHHQDQMLHRVMGNDAPSHIAHHYPVTTSMPENCPSIGMFAQSLKDKISTRQDRYSQGQF